MQLFFFCHIISLQQGSLFHARESKLSFLSSKLPKEVKKEDKIELFLEFQHFKVARLFLARHLIKMAALLSASRGTQQMATDVAHSL